jgi:uncharacterized membrane protein
MNRLGVHNAAEARLGLLALGLALYVLLRTVLYLGTLLAFAVVLLGVGVVAIWLLRTLPVGIGEPTSALRYQRFTLVTTERTTLVASPPSVCSLPNAIRRGAYGDHCW